MNNEDIIRHKLHHPRLLHTITIASRLHPIRIPTSTFLPKTFHSYKKSFPFFPILSNRIVSDNIDWERARTRGPAARRLANNPSAFYPADVITAFNEKRPNYKYWLTRMDVTWKVRLLLIVKRLSLCICFWTLAYLKKMYKANNVCQSVKIILFLWTVLANNVLTSICSYCLQPI